MKRRDTLVLLVVALALGLYVYFFELRGPGDAAQSNNIATTVFDFSLEEAVRLEAQGAGGEAVSLRLSEGGQWMLVEEDGEEEADPDRVRRAIAALARLRPSRTLPRQEAGNLSDFGLAEPALWAQLTLASGEEYVLLLGSQNPGGTGHYAMREAGDAIYLIPNDVAETLKNLVRDPPYRPTATPAPAATGTGGGG